MPPICWRSHTKACLAGSPPSRSPLWPWPNISKPSSEKAMRPFEFCVLGLSELACFSAQTLRRPLLREAPHKGASGGGAAPSAIEQGFASNPLCCSHSAEALRAGKTFAAPIDRAKLPPVYGGLIGAVSVDVVEAGFATVVWVHIAITLPLRRRRPAA